MHICSVAQDNRKDNSSEDFCKGSQLRASGRRKSLRGMYHVQKYCVPGTSMNVIEIDAA